MIELILAFCIGCIVTFFLCWIGVRHMTYLRESDFEHAIDDIKLAINDINFCIDQAIHKVSSIEKKSNTPEVLSAKIITPTATTTPSSQ